MTHRRKLWYLIIAAVVLAVPICFSIGQSQEDQAVSGGDPGAGVEGVVGEGEDMLGEISGADGEEPRKVWYGNLVGLWRSSGLFGYVILIVFVLGVFFAIDEARIIWLDQVRGRVVVSKDLRRLTRAEHKILLAGSKPCRLLELLRGLRELKEIRTSGQEMKEDIHRQVNFFHGKFNSFLARLDYLSDSAGALGLMGTVWAIYGAFTTEALAAGDINMLITKMGLALSTTFLGLVASIVLNLLSTEVYNLHNQAMVTMTEKGEEYLVALQAGGDPTPPAGPPGREPRGRSAAPVLTQ